MKGTAHVTIGAAIGFVVSNQVTATPVETVLLIGLAGVSALVPDLDVDGKLSNKITFSHKVIGTVAQVIGMLMILYSIFLGRNENQLLGIGVGLAMLLISTFIKQRHMLLITGIGVIIGGMSFQELWMQLLGVYILVASYVSHRTYTHSILGVLYFAVIVTQLEQSIGMDGVFYAGLGGYISHLIADSKFLPFNQRGIKLFLPFSSTEM